MAFKTVKYHFTLWSKAIYEKISHIHPWITWYISAGHGILCLGSLNLNESPFKYYISILGGGLRRCLFCLFRRGWGVQNSGNPAYIILAHFLILSESYTGKTAYSAGKTSWVLRGGALGAMFWPTLGGEGYFQCVLQTSPCVVGSLL